MAETTSRTSLPRRLLLGAFVLALFLLIARSVAETEPVAEVVAVEVTPSPTDSVPSEPEPAREHGPFEPRDVVPYHVSLEYLVPSIRDVFSRHYEAAQAGDPTSQMEIGFALVGCAQVAHHVEADDLGESLRLERYHLEQIATVNEELIDAMSSTSSWLTPQCLSVDVYRPNDVSIYEWLDSYLQSAITGGDPIATFGWAIPDLDVGVESAAVVLEAALRTRHPRALGYVQDFYGRYFEPHETVAAQLAIEAFLLQSCIRHVMCDTGIARSNLALEHLPAEVERIEAMAELIDERLADPTPMNLSDPINIDLERWDSPRVPASG